MTDAALNAAQPKSRRRWCQFTLRTMLLAVAVLALPCAYVGWQAKIVAERKAWLEARPAPMFICR